MSWLAELDQWSKHIESYEDNLKPRKLTKNEKMHLKNFLSILKDLRKKYLQDVKDDLESKHKKINAIIESLESNK